MIWYYLMVEHIYLHYPKTLFMVILYQDVSLFIIELTYHIHNLHETEAEIHSEWVCVIEHRSLQWVIVFHQVSVESPLRLSLKWHCQRMNNVTRLQSFTSSHSALRTASRRALQRAVNEIFRRTLANQQRQLFQLIWMNVYWSETLIKAFLLGFSD